MIERVLKTFTLAALALALAGCAHSRPAGEAEPAAPAAATPDAELLRDAMAFIEPFEGRRHVAYRDSLGYATIGVGFNLDRPGAAEDLARLLPGIGYSDLRTGRRQLTDRQVDVLLRHDVERALDSARRHVPNFSELPRDAQLVVIDMSFNLGSLSAWRDLRAALAAADFDAAAAAMHDSRWRTQTGRRAQHLIALMDSLG